MKKIIFFVDKKFFKNFFRRKLVRKNFLDLTKRQKRIFDRKIIVLHRSSDSFLLNLLCEKYGTDKGSVSHKKQSWPQHNYADIYSLLFGHLRQDVLKVFEMGVGTKDFSIPSNMGDYGPSGASLRVWREYFPNALIFGADIDKSCLFQEERIKTFYVDQLDLKSVRNLWQSVGEGEFDLIIDDGLHTVQASINFFSESINYLKHTGTYVIEDVTEQRLQGLMEFFKQKPYQISLFSGARDLHRVGDNILIVIRENGSI